MAKFNRHEQIRRDQDLNPSHSMSLKDVDEAMIGHLTKKLKLFVVQDGRHVKVPVVMSAQDKWVQTRKSSIYKDSDGQVLLPVIVLSRTGETDDSSYQIFNEDQTLVTHRQWTKENRYDRFSVQNNWVPREEVYSVSFPQHLMVSYDVVLWTEKINHMNFIKEKILFVNPCYWGDDPRKVYLTTVSGFSNTSELGTSENKIVKTTFSLEVRAAILPEEYKQIVTNQKGITSFTGGLDVGTSDNPDQNIL